MNVIGLVLKNMFIVFKPKLILVAAVFSLLCTFFGLTAHTSAAEYVNMNDSGWTFTATGVTQQQFNTREKTAVNQIIAWKDNGATYAVFQYSTTRTEDGKTIREYFQKEDFYDNGGDAGGTSACPARINLLITDGGSKMYTPIGCNPTKEWKPFGITVTAITPDNVLAIVKSENYGNKPYGCPGITGGTLTVPPNTSLNYNCPDGINSVQAGVYKADAVIAAPTDTTDPTAGGDDEGPSPCFADGGPIGWILCPVTSAVFAAVNGLDSMINRLLTVDTSKVYNTGTDQQAKADANIATSNAYYTAWSSFRNIALGLIVIVALLIIIASAFGIEALDAYTIRKAMPRLFIAVIGIAVSWEVTEFLITLSNDVGLLVRNIIYAPFAAAMPEFTVSFGVSTLTTLLLAGAVYVYGIGILTFGGMALLAIFIAIVTLVLREMIIIFCVIIVPVAIAASILPNTQKYWSLWQKTFTTMLIAFPIITGMIALGRVFAAIAYQGGNANLFNNIIGFIAYVLPYFMLPFAFRFAGGILATISGVGNDRSKGAFDRLTKMRQNTAASRRKDVMMGENDGSGIMGAINRPMGSVYRRTALAGKGGLSLTRRGRENYAAASAHFGTDEMEERIRTSAAAREAAADDETNDLALQGYDRDKVIETLTARGVTAGKSEAAARAGAVERASAFEHGMEARLGSSKAVLAAGIGKLTSDTSYEDGTLEENNAAMFEDGLKLVQAGLMTRNKMILLMKSAKSRPSRANLAHGETLGVVSDALDKAAATGGVATIDRSEINRITKTAVDSTTSQDIMNAKPKEAEKMALYLTAQLKATAGTAHRNAEGFIDDREYLQQAATLAGIHESLTYTSPTKANAIADNMMAATIAEEGGKSVYTVLEELKTGSSRVVDSQGRKVGTDGQVIQAVGTRTVKVLDSQGKPIKDKGIERTRTIEIDKWGNEVQPQMVVKRTGRDPYLERKYTFGSEAGEQQAARTAQQAGVGMQGPPPPAAPPAGGPGHP